MRYMCRRCSFRLAEEGRWHCTECRKLCTLCNQRPHARNHPHCKECKRDYMRQHRMENPRNAEDAARDRAVNLINTWIRRGHMKRGDCIVKGCEEKACAYHKNVNVVTDVTWLCRRHLRMMRSGLGAIHGDVAGKHSPRKRSEP